MNKKELAKKLAEVGTFKTIKESEEKLDAVIEAIVDTFEEGEELSIFGFGKFEVVERPERVGRNPKTGEALTIPAKKTLKFKASKTLLEKIN